MGSEMCIRDRGKTGGLHGCRRCCPTCTDRIAVAAKMKYGYARVSTDDQNAALQLAALKRAGCKTIFKDDGLSGATTNRPALQRCLGKLDSGDTLIVWKLDRLGRSLRDLIAMLDDLRARGIKFNRLPKPSTPRRPQAAPCGK